MKRPTSLESSVFALFYRLGETVGDVTIESGLLISTGLQGPRVAEARWWHLTAKDKVYRHTYHKGQQGHQ